MDQIIESLTEQNMHDLGNSLREGHIAVIPTDTQYGIVTSAQKTESVEKIYHLRKRSPEKPMIILISDVSQIKDLGIELSTEQLEIMKKLWPNPVSIIIPVKSPTLNYLHRGKKSLAFRLPNSKQLQNLLQISGPLVAPSANFEGETPAATIEQAKKYFGENVDFYIDSGELHNPPSTVISLESGAIKIIRQGAFKLT